MKKMHRKDREWLKNDTLSARRLAEENLKNLDKPRKPVKKSFLSLQDEDECPRCFVRILKGDRVRFDEDGFLVHVRHNHGPEKFTICEKCYLTLPCECS